MKKHLSMILILACSILLLAGSIIIYCELTKPDGSEGIQDLAPVQDDFSADTPGIFHGGSEEEPVPAEQTPAYAPEDTTREPAVDFNLTDRDGNPCRLSDFYGKPIIINFWATWCGPCKMELPHFDAAASNYDGQIQFLMVDLVDGSYETEDAALAFVAENGYSFPLFFDSYDEASMAYGITAIPFTVVIDPYGRIVTTHLGSMTAGELQELIDMVLQ